jgi:CMP-N-acetylneuraminic acid synthetase
MFSNKPRVIALIPARGGSKGIKKKNIRLVNGKPLIYYTIKAAKKSKLIDRVVVSTDDKRIKLVAIKYGAEVPFIRPKRLSQDHILDYPVILHAIKKLKLNSNKQKNDILVFLRPTMPLRNYKDIDVGIKEILTNKNVKCVRSVREATYPPFWIKRLDKNKYLKPLVNKTVFKKTMRRQDLPKTYICDGYLDAIKINYLLEEKRYPPRKIKTVYSKTKYFVDVDNEEDLDIAGALLNII